MIQKRKKSQFNLIDVLIVMVILGLIATAAYWIFGGFRDSRDADSAPLTFEVRISNVQEAALPLITEGLAVKDSVTGDTLGTILSVKTEKSRHYGGVYKDENGGYTLGTSEYPDEYDVYVTVSANAESDERGIYTVGSVRVLIGETVYFQIRSFSAVSYIVSTAISG